MPETERKPNGKLSERVGASGEADVIPLAEPADLLTVISPEADNAGALSDPDIGKIVDSITVDGECWRTRFACVAGMPQMRLAGRGRVSVRRYLAHRIAGVPYGSVTRAFVIGLTCGKPDCVRPEHFDLTTTVHLRHRERE
jgi:hypothetical protein